MQGSAWLGKAGHGSVWHGKDSIFQFSGHGKARLGSAWRGPARRGEDFICKFCVARPGNAWLGMAERGKARQGEDLMANDELAKTLREKIDDYCRRAYDGGHRAHLGASLIGHDCSRHLWYSFRWAKHEIFTPRMLRLFQRGHLEEARFIEYLRGAGWEVTTKPEIGKDKQYRVSAVMGHFGGSLDGIGRPDTGLVHPVEDDGDAYLLEFKTSATGAGFNALLEKGVQRFKPRHWAQMCVYGALRKLRHAVYLTVNKNDDDLHLEVVDLDHDYGNELVAKAHSIIMSQEPPPRIAQSAAFHTCKFCHFSGICFRDEAMEKNCRSCVNAIPVENAEWFCRQWQSVIPKNHLKDGCDQWEQIR